MQNQSRSVACSTKLPYRLSQKSISSGTLFCLPATIVLTCFDKNTVWVHYKALSLYIRFYSCALVWKRYRERDFCTYLPSLFYHTYTWFAYFIWCVIPIHLFTFLVRESTDSLCSSGVARTSLLLGHSMGTLRLYKLPCKVQKLIGGSGGHPPHSLPSRFWGHIL